jgi:hypothetical protein
VTISFARHQFPPVIIRHAVWLCVRFTPSYRAVKELLAERGLHVSYETVRRWVLKFGPLATITIAPGILNAFTYARRCRGPKADADRERENNRIAAIEREYRAKLGDLQHNYALRITVDWIQTLELFVPVQRLEVLVRRRKGERVIQLDWRPLVRVWDVVEGAVA